MEEREYISRAIINLSLNCSALETEDKVLVIYEDSTKEIAQMIYDVITGNGNSCNLIRSNSLIIHGSEPSDEIKNEMLKSDTIFGLTKYSMAHTQARFEASRKGAKYLSLPDYSIDVLNSPSLLTDFKSLTDLSYKIADLLTQGESIRIISAKGTDLKCNIKDRKANAAPGWCFDKGVIASPPDAETNIALEENSSNGLLVVDGSIPCPQIGKLNEPLYLEIVNGFVVNIEGIKSNALKALFEDTNDKNSKIPAEFGIGINHNAKITGKMLEDEGALGTIHIGIGSNFSIGGKNNVPFHLDHIVMGPSVYIDDFLLMESGKLKI